MTNTEPHTEPGAEANMEPKAEPGTHPMSERRKRLLVIFSGPVANPITLKEALQATMVLATFGSEVSVLFRSEALALLAAKTAWTAGLPDWRAMIESFEWYDLSPIWVEAHSDNKKSIAFPVIDPALEIQSKTLDADLLATFDQVIHW